MLFHGLRWLSGRDILLFRRQGLTWRSSRTRKSARRLTPALALWKNLCYSSPGIIKRHSGFQAFCSACFAVSMGFACKGLLVCNFFPVSVVQRFFMACAGRQAVAFFWLIAKV